MLAYSEVPSQMKTPRKAQREIEENLEITVTFDPRKRAALIAAAREKYAENPCSDTEPDREIPADEYIVDIHDAVMELVNHAVGTIPLLTLDGITIRAGENRLSFNEPDIQ
jgi:hypothetical protein